MKTLIENLLKEKLHIIREIDWSNQFGDVSKKGMSIEDAKKYLDKVVGNCQKKPADRTPTALDKPYIHAKKIKKTDDGDIDIESFINDITKMPKDILSVNLKMLKSSDENTVSVNIGIPALRGLVYDIDENMFYIVNTCPGAGPCALICYARKGSYVMFPDVFVKQTRVLNLLLNFPERFEKLLLRELESFALKYPEKEIQMRWNDAGDFFSKTYFDIAGRITETLIKDGYNVKSYGYTKMGDIINLKDPNMVMNFSNDANKKQTGKVNNLDKVKKSVIVPKKLFDDLLVKNKTGRNYEVNDKGKVIYKSPEAIIELKNRLAKTYNVDAKTILTYDEMLNTPIGEPLSINVIIAPKGDGDKPAQRKDVLISFLCFH